MAKVSINNLAQYAQRINTPYLPTDALHLIIPRSARDWIVADLLKRKKKLEQAISDPKIKESKAKKRHSELYMLSVTLDRLQSAERIEP